LAFWPFWTICWPKPKCPSTLHTACWSLVLDCFGSTEGEKWDWHKNDHYSVWTVRGTVHLFIGTGRSPDKITFMSLLTNYNHNVNYWGLYSLFLFKSVSSFAFITIPSQSSFGRSFSFCSHYLWLTSSCHTFLCTVLPKVFLLWGPSAEEKTPNSSPFAVLDHYSKRARSTKNIAEGVLALTIVEALYIALFEQTLRRWWLALS
jgi:hypothetical protein